MGKSGDACVGHKSGMSSHNFTADVHYFPYFAPRKVVWARWPLKWLGLGFRVANLRSLPAPYMVLTEMVRQEAEAFLNCRCLLAVVLCLRAKRADAWFVQISEILPTVRPTDARAGGFGG